MFPKEASTLKMCLLSKQSHIMIMYQLMTLFRDVVPRGLHLENLIFCRLLLSLCSNQENVLAWPSVSLMLLYYIDHHKWVNICLFDSLCASLCFDI